MTLDEAEGVLIAHKMQKVQGFGDGPPIWIIRDSRDNTVYNLKLGGWVVWDLANRLADINGETVYYGYPPSGIVVRCQGGELTLLNPRYDISYHSDGFAWGYLGSGPTQLSIALLAEVVNTNGRRYFGDQVMRYSFDFKNEVVANWRVESPWSLHQDVIKIWLKAVKARKL